MKGGCYAVGFLNLAIGIAMLVYSRGDLLLVIGSGPFIALATVWLHIAKEGGKSGRS